ncbi:MAG: hypothetical protein KA160_03635 [Lacibacter sp.]|nr:hypothetical protein [Lacibacter sp.]
MTHDESSATNVVDGSYASIIFTKKHIWQQHLIDSTKQLPIEELRKRADSVLLQQCRGLNWGLLL